MGWGMVVSCAHNSTAGLWWHMCKYTIPVHSAISHTQPWTW
jgi:hypothetical protein